MASVWDNVHKGFTILNDYSLWGRCSTHTDSLDLLCAIPQLGNEDTKRVTNTSGSHIWNRWFIPRLLAEWVKASRSEPSSVAVPVPGGHWAPDMGSFGLRGLGVTHILDSPSVFRCSYVGCIYIYNCYIFFMGWSFNQYVVLFFVSCNSVYFQVFWISISPILFWFVWNNFFIPSLSVYSCL